MTDLRQGDRTRVFPAGPRTGCYFPTAAAERARNALVRCIERMDGPALLIGPSGTGKSLMLAALAEHFRFRLSVANLPGGGLRSLRELHQSVLYALGLPFRGLDEGELKLSLLERLEGDDDAHEGVLLLVDEAQSLSLELMEELRMLTNIVRDGVSRVRLVLAGTPSLEEQLTDARLASFDQRIAVRCYLQEMSRAETKAYVQAHLKSAGQQVQLFTLDALEAIHESSEGLPRLVNQICDHALLLAQAEGRAAIDAAIVQEAWSDLQQLPMTAPPSPAPAGDATEDIIEFGVWEGAAEMEPSDDAFDASEEPYESRSAQIAERSGHGFSIVHDDPSDRIDTIQEQLASLTSEGEAAAEEVELRDHRAPDLDFSLPDDEWPEVEVVVRDAPAVLLDGFFEEEVIADPFATLSTRVQENWAGARGDFPERAALARGAGQSAGPPPEPAPLQSVPLMFHVQTDLYAPDPVLPEEAAGDPAIAKAPGPVIEQEPALTERQPELVREHRLDKPNEQRPAAEVRPAKRGPSPRPAQKRFATLFSNLQG